jgi:hypothetical protein
MCPGCCAKTAVVSLIGSIDLFVLRNTDNNCVVKEVFLGDDGKAYKRSVVPTIGASSGG